MTEAHDKWTYDMFGVDVHGIGLELSDFSHAISIYVSMNMRPVSVADLIRAFNTDRASVLAAIAEGCLLYVVGPHDDDSKRIVGVDGVW